MKNKILAILLTIILIIPITLIEVIAYSLISLFNIILYIFWNPTNIYNILVIWLKTLDD
jgi:hypothetical protein